MASNRRTIKIGVAASLLVLMLSMYLMFEARVSARRSAALKGNGNQEVKEYYRDPRVVAAMKTLERYKHRWIYLQEVEKESIPETVAALRTLNYSELFSPKLGNPGLFGIPADVTEYIDELMKEPRIQKLMRVAQSSVPQDREELLALLDEDWETYRFGEDSRPNGFSPAGKPREGVPLLLAVMDQEGEMLGRLVEMAREYSEKFEANSHPKTLEYGQGGSNQYSSVLGTAMEVVLANIAQSKSAGKSTSLNEYWNTRRSLAAYGSDRVEADAMQRMLEDASLGEKAMQDTPGIIPLYWHLIYTNASRDVIAQHLPDWFGIGSPDWLVISLGCKVHAEIKLDQ